jgi:hypothetical protein
MSLYYTDNMSVLALAAPGTSTGLNTGLHLSVVSPMPSWPYWLSPQHLMLPPVTMAHVWPNPVAMAMAETPVWRETREALRIHETVYM